MTVDSVTWRSQKPMEFHGRRQGEVDELLRPEPEEVPTDANFHLGCSADL